MEAKDTVMDTNQLKDIVLKKYCSPETTRRDITISDHCYDMVEAQAEITGKIMYKAGRREVVEWVESTLLVHPDNRKNFWVEWEDKLKDWGVYR